MTRNESLELLAHGELSASEAADLVRETLAAEPLPARRSEELYSALRSCVWKMMDSRRRDQEINSWLAVLSRAATKFGGEERVRLEAFVELLQISSMAAEVERRRNPLSTKHARRLLVLLREARKPLAKRRLAQTLRMKDSTLTQAMAPLIDHGFVSRAFVGREVEYLLTREGRAQIDKLEPLQPAPEEMIAEMDLGRKYVSRKVIERTYAHHGTFGHVKVTTIPAGGKISEGVFGSSYAIGEPARDGPVKVEAKELAA